MFIQFLVPRHTIVHAEKYWAGSGGSENALVQVARHLSLHGHRVRVVANTGGYPEGIFDGVEYVNGWVEHSCDVLVYFRGSYPLAKPVSAKRRLWFTTDAYLEGDHWEQSLFPKVDAGICISEFHRDDLHRRYRNLPPLTVIPLGCDPAESFYGKTFRDAPAAIPLVEKVPNRLIYCSEPARGLEHVLRAWPHIRREVPDATLSVTFDYRLWNHPARNTAHFERLAAQPGIDYHGCVPRNTLLLLQAAAQVHIYPCTFPENFCLASLECQLQGTPTVGTRIGALPTTIRDGGVVCDHPDHVAGMVLQLLRLPSLEGLQHSAHRHALTVTWEDTARAWEEVLSR